MSDKDKRREYQRKWQNKYYHRKKKDPEFVARTRERQRIAQRANIMKRNKNYAIQIIDKMDDMTYDEKVGYLAEWLSTNARTSQL